MSESASSETTKPSATDIDLTLSQIAGVYAACAVLNQKRDLIEIHIVASAARKPKKIIRDIETLVFVKHKIKVDYRMISLVQLPDEKLLRIPVARPEIRDVTEENLGAEKRIRVEIQGASRIVSGEAIEKVNNPMSFRSGAQATINAVEKLVGNYMDVRLEETATMQIGNREVLMVIVSCLTQDREETFVGTSFVGAKPVESAARATLDALNRRIHNFTLQAPRQSDDS
ncbi:MAG: hypothetical protein HY868_27630 [Chloroflexi bacterium]|nr:hypothetical protein [Chloroflexota bacterium]